VFVNRYSLQSEFFSRGVLDKLSTRYFHALGVSVLGSFFWFLGVFCMLWRLWKALTFIIHIIPLIAR